MASTDIDALETREWLESLDGVLEHDGPDRANFLLDRLAGRASRAGAHLPLGGQTPYVNTIPVSEEPSYPGDEALENRLSSLIRWNAMATVLQANKTSSELGGHIASYQSAATLYEVGFNHFWHAPVRGARRRPRLLPGPLGAWYVLAGLPRGPGNGVPAAALPPGGRRARALRRRRHLLVPAPVAHAGALAVPHRLDGPRADHGHLPGALHEVPAGARDRGHLGPQGVGVPRRRRDRRARVARRDRPRGPRAPRQPRLRRQLQPAAPRRPRPRQREDHPGARDDLPRRGLERRQGRLGLAVGPVARGRPRGPARAAHGGGRRRRVPGVQGARRRLRARALLRGRPEAARDGRPHERRGGLGAQPRRPRPQEDLRRLRRRQRAHRPADGHPRQDHQGLRDGHGRRGPEHHPSAEEDGRDRAAEVARPVRPGPHRRAGPRGGVRQARRRHAGDELPARAPQGARRRAAGAAADVDGAGGPRRSPRSAGSSRRPASARSRRRWPSSGSSTRCCATRRSASTSSRSCPTSRARSAWRGCSGSSGSSARSASCTSPRTPTSSCSTRRTSRARCSRRASTSPARSPPGSPRARRTPTTTCR